MIICNDAFSALLDIPPGSIDACITSPPYYALRDYGTDGQIGLEETPQKYLYKLLNVFRQVKRVLKDDGTLWIVIGDSYAGSSKGGNIPRYEGKQETNRGTASVKGKMTFIGDGIKRKDLIGIPWELAFMLRRDGWYLRQDIIWHKPNAMPESVKDRCTRSHEYIFLLSKSEHYYFDHEAIKESAVGFDKSPVAGSIGVFGIPQSRRRKGNSRTFRGGGAYTGGKSYQNSVSAERDSHGNEQNYDGLRNKRDVWSVATNSPKFSGSRHYATFPEKLIEPCVLASTKPYDIVLDPFCGIGTTGVVSERYGRQFMGIDINEEYCSIAEKRISKNADTQIMMPAT